MNIKFWIVVLALAAIIVILLIRRLIRRCLYRPVIDLKTFNPSYRDIKLDQRVVISTTTIPGRLKYINNIINNMYDQYYRTEGMYVNIPYVCRRNGEKYSEDDIKNIDTKGGWVKIVRCEDFGPATKLLGCMEEEVDPNTIIITVDDDQVYRKEVIGMFCYYSKLYPNSTLATEVMMYDMNKGISTDKVCEDPLTSVYAEGFGGVLYYRKHFNDNDIQYVRKTITECVKSDDLVLSTILASKNIRRLKLNVGTVREDNDVVDSVDALKNDSRKLTYQVCQQHLIHSFMKVPAVIHLIYYPWSGSTLPSNYKKNMENMKEMAPDFNVYLHTEKEMDLLVRKYSDRLGNVYDNVVNRVMKVDISRLVLLYFYGGFYFDLDIEFNRNIRLAPQIYPNKDVYLFTEHHMLFDGENTRIANYAIASVPQHAFIELCLNILMNRCKDNTPPFDKSSDDYVIWATGPDVVSHALHLVIPEHSMHDLSRERKRYRDILERIDTTNRENVKVINKNISDHIFTHHAKGSWRKNKL